LLLGLEMAELQFYFIFGSAGGFDAVEVVM
jgi:hypothetical protein